MIAALALLLLVQGQSAASGTEPVPEVQPQVSWSVRFNRAEGLAPGVGLAMRAAPRTTVVARARYGWTDGRPQGRLSFERSGPTAWALDLFSGFLDADPLAAGLSTGNSASALLLTHDDGAYVHAAGAEATAAWRAGEQAWQVTLGARHERAPRRLARSEVNDALGGSGELAPHDPVARGTFGVARVTTMRGGADAHWHMALEARAGSRGYLRGWAGGSRRVEIGAGLDLAAHGWIGAGGGGAVPQAQFRVGGLRSLRGYPAGHLSGRSAVTASLDLGAAHRIISPILFLDAGAAGTLGNPFEDGAASLGVGISVLRGRIRVHAGRPLEDRPWRFDVVVAAHR